ncbi:EamA family transporter [Anaerocolumna sp. MB42-C2]|uniref:EamA family transporter n=1 Tax=Anaerocolumna sp. MB42-C2 TaxID=3070997 RepID=UPI0027E16B6B|nr:EamA family transporter [Anaerocolumna sp. MB42-C2]WMJ89796.1 EamA family transporter [Anaerocolumna sp. MB42-C2]
MVNFILLIIMTFIGALAGYCLKRASSSESLIMLLSCRYFYFGAILYLLSALINIYILRFMDYSIVLPLTSITYIWTMFISFKKLGERISKKKITGIFLIIIGALCIVM